MDKQKIYFPNLNGIRFIAAFLVIIHHIEQLKHLFHLESYWGLPFISIIGRLGVVLFFVLSGFLITYLLLAEESVFNTISIKNFYIRRILRIWPLYFLIVLLALFVLPQISLFMLPGYSKETIHQDLPAKLILFVLFLPNLVLSLLGVVPYASQTWSIGTEEQFYLVWPVILKYIRKYRLALMFFILFGYLLVEKLLSSHSTDFIPYKNVIMIFWSTFNIQCMAIGGIFAVLLFHKHAVLRFICNQYLFYAVLLAVIALLLAGIRFPYFNYEIYAFLFGLLILNFAANKDIKVSLENRMLNYLGNISYGLYMYHPIGIVLSIFIAGAVGGTSNWLIYPLSLLFTIGLAALSYRYFESFFLKFKHKFSGILSGNSVKN